MNIMAEAHRRARYEHDLQVCIAHGVFSPSRIALGDVGDWRRGAAHWLIANRPPAPGINYAAILADELRYLHWRDRRMRKEAA